MKHLLDFFMDGKGNMSMTRLATLILVLTGCVFAFIYPDYEGGYLGIITLGLGGKLTGKHFEKKKYEKE